MWDSDIEKMAKLIMAKKVLVKSAKSLKKQAVMETLYDACHAEKRPRIMKNEFMQYFKKKKLRCKTLKVASYTDKEYHQAAEEFKVTKATIDMWYQKVSKDPTGERY